MPPQCIMHWGGFLGVSMTFEELKNKAHRLPAEPGVYMMRDKKQNVIYVGKAKRLKNRVSSYFVDSISHSVKTRTMISKIFDFDVIIAASEFEALVLECSLIKRYTPRYNILLKDDKGYPYIRLDNSQIYPVFSIANRLLDDRCEYFGPFGSRKTTRIILDSVLATLSLPICNKVFPDDFGKGRPCLHYHMHQCAGWCMGELGNIEYLKLISQARNLLRGDYKSVSNDLKKEMLKASEELDFELAAMIRDRLKALEALNTRQLVTAASDFDMDIIGYFQNESKGCFVVLHYAGGNLIDKDIEILPPSDSIEEALSSIILQYYSSRNFSPKRVLIPCNLEDAVLIEQFLRLNINSQSRVIFPQRGDSARLIKLAKKNAAEEVERVTTKEERISGVLENLGKMLSINTPLRIESYDISNISGTDIVGSMVVFANGKPCKAQYRKFKIRDLSNQNDYESMRQMLERRIAHFEDNTSGFEFKPDLLLIDGGHVHAGIVQELLSEHSLDWPVFGMVKDDRHRTRALMDAQGDVIAIDNNQSIFSFIGIIQEETHRFAISYHKALRSKRLHYSCLDEIPGIGPKRKQDLLRFFKSIAAIRAANIFDLERILPRTAAKAVFDYFNSKEKGE